MTPDDLRPRIGWKAVQSCFDNPIFDAAGTAELLMAVGRPVSAEGLSIERVQDELREITAHFAFDRYQELAPSTSNQDAQMANLAQALSIALETVGFEGEPSNESLLPMFGPGALFAAAKLRGEASGEGATMNALRAVWLLRQDALKVREIYGNRRTIAGQRKGRSEERAIKRLAAYLSDLYWLTWVEAPGVALNDEGGPNSPFMRLFARVQGALFERGVDHSRTAASLAQVWHRLDDSDKLKFRGSE